MHREHTHRNLLHRRLNTAQGSLTYRTRLLDTGMITIILAYMAFVRLLYQ